MHRDERWVLESVSRWLNQVVVAMDLCPFAAMPLRENRVRLVVVPESDPDDAVMTALREAVRLLDTPPAELGTTLVIFPSAFEEFTTFLMALDAFQDTLSTAGAGGVIQVASFHPKYRFDGTHEDTLSNYTNRSPYPIFHLLRETELSEAIDSHGNTTEIPEANIARLNNMGRDAIEALWRGFTQCPDNAAPKESRDDSTPT